MDNVRIVRLVSGEDIIAFYEEDEDMALVGNPMTMVFKRLPTGKAVMLMAPWLPLEVVEEDIVSIPYSQIITVMNPKKHMSEYFINSVMDMEQELSDNPPEELSLRDASPTEEEILEGYNPDSTKRTIH
jgi:hypothetical protein